MSTNPNNAVGTNAAYGGRTSVKAFNDNIGAYSRGIISGWACSPSSGMTVSLGGDGTTRDIAIAEDVSGNKITINNISEAPISVTMSAAPSSNSRIDLIVAYVDNPPQGSATALDNPAACGLITVSGTAAANPVAPSESVIRTAITADGASGSTAYYVILAQITIAAGTTDIVAGNISAGSAAGIGAQNIDFTTLSASGSNANEITVPYNTYTDVVSVDVSNIPNGKKILVFTSARLAWGGDNVTFNWNLTNQNNTNLAGQAGYAPGQTWGFVATLAKLVQKTAALTSVKLRFQKQDNTGNVKIGANDAIIVVIVLD